MNTTHRLLLCSATAIAAPIPIIATPANGSMIAAPLDDPRTTDEPKGNYAELKALIREAGLMKQQPVYYSVKIAYTLALLGLGLVTLFLFDNFWVRALNAAYLAGVLAHLGFLGHGRGHRQLKRGIRRIGRALGIVVIAALLIQPADVFAVGATHADILPAPTTVPMQGGFLKTFQKYGLSLIGYPLSEELDEGGVTMQYFERVKMEYHPELAAKGTPVLFSRLGSEVSAGSAFVRIEKPISTKQKRYFGQTSHLVTEPFLSFWSDKGRLDAAAYSRSAGCHAGSGEPVATQNT